MLTQYMSLTGSGIAETDSVLTTTELQRLLQEQGLNLDHIKGQDLDNIFGGREPTLSGMPGGSGETLQIFPNCLFWYSPLQTLLLHLTFRQLIHKLQLKLKEKV